MAHFAEIVDGIVKRVIVVNNEDIKVNGVESEIKGKEFCNQLLGGEWIQTSYNGKIRKQYAGKGYIYDKDKDIFISPKPHPSWILDENNDWQAPVIKPDGDYIWNEENKEWQSY